MRTGILVLALAALAGGTARAQKVLQKGNTRAGFWIGFGVGAGSAGTDCSSCSTERFAGLSGYLRLGGTVSQHILIGGETNGWVHSQRGADENMGFLSAVLVWYPSRTGAFFLKSGSVRSSTREPLWASRSRLRRRAPPSVWDTTSTSGGTSPSPHS
jgi:hypothetical protein